MARCLTLLAAQAEAGAKEERGMTEPERMLRRDRVAAWCGAEGGAAVIHAVRRASHGR